jgi:hypothetical protein
MRAETEQKADGRGRSRQGSILLETILAIPLYMILLGGILWIGDLIVTRQQLVIADRYVAWNKGMRHDDRGQTDAGTVHRLFFAESNGSPSQYHRPAASDGRIDGTFDWSHRASGQVRLDMRMPEWTRYLFNAGQVMYNSGVPLEEVSAMQGRDKPDQRHVVLMRTKEEAQPDYIRNKYGVRNSAQVADQWRRIASEKWPYD